MSDTRTESDSLGEIEVPQNALYGAQTARAVENFSVSGLKPWPAFVWAMATIKLAAAEVNHALDQLDRERSQAIIQAAREVLEGKWSEHFVVDPFQAGAGTSHCPRWMG
jgi:fumarate hydratase class II